MVSVRTRAIAFAPLLTLTLLTGAAAFAGYRTDHSIDSAQKPPGASSAGTPTPSPTASPYVPIDPSRAVPPPVPTFVPVTLSKARSSWDHALDKLIASGSGKYSWGVYYGSRTVPIQSESGVFDLNPLRSRFDRTLGDPDDDPVVLHMRSLGSTAYLRVEDWGRWDGCWLPLTSNDVERATGVKIAQSVPLPATVLAISDATPSSTRGFWFGAPYREYTAELGAGEALQFLGVSPRVFAKQIDRLREVLVPVTVSIDAAGRMHGGGARGSEVASAIEDAHVKLSKKLLEGLPSIRASFAFRDPGSAVSVSAPPPSLLLPRNATRRDTCKSGGPHA